MEYGTLVLCTVVLYGPHAALCGLALAWQPMLLVAGLLASFVAMGALLPAGVVLQLATLLGHGGGGGSAVGVVLLGFAGQSVLRVVMLNACLLLHRAGRQHGWLLVRSRFPLVPLSIAIGAGFATSSLIVGGGNLLAVGWEARRALNGQGVFDSPVFGSVAEASAFLSASGSCARLPRLVQSCFQQTFFTCCQVAWTVMMGQAYAALRPHDVSAAVAADVDGAAPLAGSASADTPASLGGTSGGCVADPHRPHDTSAEVERRYTAELLAVDEQEFRPIVPRGGGADGSGTSARQPVPREESEAQNAAAAGLENAAAAPAGAKTSADCDAGTRVSPPPPADAAAAVAGSLVADSVLQQWRPTAVLTGAAALALHALFVVVPLTSIAGDAAAGGGAGRCLVTVPLQCTVTLVSVLWGLWIVHLERHPSEYLLLDSSRSS